MISFKSFLREETERVVFKLANEFKDEYEGEAGDEAFGSPLDELCDEGGNCSMISHEFSKWLDKRGVENSIITGEDPTNKSWNDGDKGFYPSDDPPPDIVSHAAVRIGTHVIDFNAKQFDKNLEYPRIITVGDFDEEWNKVT